MRKERNDSPCLHTFCFALAMAMLLFSPGPTRAFAQGIITGGISGSVGDQSGAVIPGAMVIAVSDSTGISLDAKTNAEGAFLISNAPIGTYTVTITAEGFGNDKVTHVTVAAGNTSSIGKRALGLGPRSPGCSRISQILTLSFSIRSLVATMLRSSICPSLRPRRAPA